MSLFFSDINLQGNDLINATVDASLNSVSNVIVGNFALSAVTDDLSTSALSSQFPTANAVKLAIDAVNGVSYLGGIDCSLNPDYPAGEIGSMSVVTVGGRIGGALGAEVSSGDFLICHVDASPAGDHATVGANWDIVQGNIEKAVIGSTAAAVDIIPVYTGVSGTEIKASSVAISAAGEVLLPAGGALEIDSNVVLNQTTLGTTVTDSSLTSVGTLVSGNATAIVDSATTLVSGKVRLATPVETLGTSDTIAVTPNGLNALGFIRKYVSALVSVTSETILGSVHGLTEILHITVFSDNGSDVFEIVHTDTTFNNVTKDVTITCDTPVTGNVVILGM